jgi:small-conductance mechanosensitive channel
MQQLQTVILGNRLQDYGLAVVTWITVWVLGPWVVHALTHSGRKLTQLARLGLGDFGLAQLGKVPKIFYLVLGAFLGINWLSVSGWVYTLFKTALLLVAVYSAVKWVIALLGYSFDQYYARTEGVDESSRETTKSMLSMAYVLVWVAGALFILDNLGVNISTLVAGLGIGGIAVALAAQTVLGDLFSSLSIFLDKPFKVGDLITVHEITGHIEKIGIKTTHLRSLSGEQIVFANSDLTSNRIRNFKRMSRRRVVFQLGVTYAARADQLKHIPKLIQSIIQQTPMATFDRAHFISFGDFSLNFEVVYFVESADYNRYMDIHQSINLAIKEQIEGLGVEFAFPTQTIHLTRSEASNKPNVNV